ncbi:MAG: hypothetical protein SGJ01_17620 [Gemmatimonadota bacterium]|nr:hypothetical protein [Gemmatimonadota bacterium]
MTAKSDDLTELETLVKQLSAAPKLIELGKPLGPEGTDELATELAAGLMDVRRSSDRIFRELLPRLHELQPTDEDFADVLHAIGEEYRHIYYHLRHTRFYDYVVPDL